MTTVNPRTALAGTAFRCRRHCGPVYIRLDHDLDKEDLYAVRRYGSSRERRYPDAGPLYLAEETVGLPSREWVVVS